jgi:hypothetical protein
VVSHAKVAFEEFLGRLLCIHVASFHAGVTSNAGTQQGRLLAANDTVNVPSEVFS